MGDFATSAASHTRRLDNPAASHTHPSQPHPLEPLGEASAVATRPAQHAQHAGSRPTASEGRTLLRAMTSPESRVYAAVEPTRSANTTMLSR